MIIAGHGGLGIELLGLMINDHLEEEIMFYDEDKEVSGGNTHGARVSSSLKEVEAFFRSSTENFVVGIGHPRLRQKVTTILEEIGGTAFNYIAPTASIHPGEAMYSGLVAQPGAGISHHSTVGKSCSLHINAVIGHHVQLGDYVTIGPNVSIIGPTSIGDFCRIGSNAVVLPNTQVGNNVIIPAGSIVEGDVEDNTTYSKQG